MALHGSMNQQELDAFLAEPHLARIATIRENRPHVVPMWFEWDGESLWMETGLGFQKHKNLLANPACAVTIDVTEGALRLKGAILEGEAELITEPQEFARETAARIYRRYLTDEEIAQPTPQEMINNPHAIIRLRPTRIQTWDQTGGDG